MGVAEDVKKWTEMVRKKEELLVKSWNRVAFAWTLVALCWGPEFPDGLQQEEGAQGELQEQAHSHQRLSYSGHWFSRYTQANHLQSSSSM
ncbi:hypothetical protein Bca52824_010780 [Brassica carinata]|uniref:Uncharacterized protein n=1 Tax=Brassica carinata TaxID=52824 RepID=A0A8X7WEY6_BRACI|nr:hypothetical protein Bca52824_010780 [Brassica carinata]